MTQYYCFDEHTRIPDIVVISTNIWNQMSDNQKEIMTTTAQQMTEDYKTAWADFENEILAAAEEKGVEMIRDVDVDAFKAAVQPIYDSLEADQPDVYAYVERIQNFSADGAADGAEAAADASAEADASAAA